MKVPRLIISSAWSHQIGGQTEFQIESGTLDQIIRNFAEQAPILSRRLIDPEGRPYTFYNIFVDGKQVPRGALSSVEAAGDSTIELIPPMAGG